MKKILKVFSLAPPRLGGLDMLLPIFVEMKRHNKVIIELIVVDNLLLSQLKRDKFLFQQVLETVDKISLLPKRKLRGNSNFISQLLRIFVLFYRMLGILFRITLSRKPVLMHSGTTSNLLINVFHKAIKMRMGNTVGHFKLMDLYKSNVESGNITVKDNFGDIFLCFHKQNFSTWDEISKGKCIDIGYPRLYDSWTEKLRSSAKHYVDQEIGINSGPLAVIFLPSTLIGAFQEDEMEIWLPEVIFCLASEFPDNVIVLKPHPMQNLKHLDTILNKIDNKNCVKSYLHPGLLASQAVVVISHHSSTILDALALNIPVIQHQILTDHWMKLHPEGSSFLDLGHSWTKTSSDLIHELQRIRRGQWTPPDFISRIGHSNGIASFFEKIGM